MGLHPDFPTSPYAPLVPEHRWLPADERLRANADKLQPPLVPELRRRVARWRADRYRGASATSLALLRWWFETEHLADHADGSASTFRYYASQREAVETVIWLHDVARVRDKHDLLRYDASGRLSGDLFPEDWPRYVLKLATGAGKTKVLSLLIAWSYFHRLYEPDSTLARNALLIAPNIIVLERLRADFDGLRIFFADPVLPDNGEGGRAWRDDFQMTVHVQDEVRIGRPFGNLFLTNVHRLFLNEPVDPSLGDEDLTDYFLAPFGPRPTGATNDSRTDLGEIIREIDELAVFDDEAHHIHDEKLAWSRSIRDIHARLLQKERRLSLQIDVTATPKHPNGAIFPQAISDYPLVEAIHQNVVKHPVLPDAASRAKLHEQASAVFCKKYADYLRLGIQEWRASDAIHAKLRKKAILFVMVGWIRLRETPAFRTEPRGFIAPRRSLFSAIVGEASAGGFELAFAQFLDRDADDVVAFAKNYQQVGFKLDYVADDGSLKHYVPDFLVKSTDGAIWIIETKGRQELDLPRKMARLRQWCADATAASAAVGGPVYRFRFVDDASFAKHRPKNLAGLAAAFMEYQS